MRKLSVGAILPILLVGDVTGPSATTASTRSGNRLFGLFPYVLVGMVPGVYVLLKVDDQQFKLVLGLLVLADAGAEPPASDSDGWQFSTRSGSLPRWASPPDSAPSWATPPAR